MSSIDMMRLAIVVAAGLCFGSFITLASFRLPRGQDILTAASRCTSCGRKLGVRDLLPLLSWIFNGAKCRYCKARIHWRYPLIELITVGVFLLLYFQHGLNSESVLLALLAVALLVMSVADLEHYVIPDEVHYVLLALGIAYRYVNGGDWLDALGGLLLGAAIGLGLRYGYAWLRHREGLGLGDVKFLLVAGLWLGVKPLLPFLFFSGLLGVATALLWQGLKRGKLFPFGPALALALFLCVAFPALPDMFWHMQRWVIR